MRVEEYRQLAANAMTEDELQAQVIELAKGFGWLAQRSTVCTEDGCDRKIKSRQLCAKHYQRHQSAGTLSTVGHLDGPTPLAARFFSKVSEPDANGCWLWTAGIGEHGYGRISAGPPSYEALLAHRVSYELIVGPIPEGLVIDHLCRVRRCVNPVHLEPVPQGENALRGEAPTIQLWRSDSCKRGHDLTVHGYVRPDRGNRQCNLCRQLRRRGLQ